MVLGNLNVELGVLVLEGLDLVAEVGVLLLEVDDESGDGSSVHVDGGSVVRHLIHFILERVHLGF